MASYLRLGTRSTRPSPSTSHQPDFGAFDDSDDDDQDDAPPLDSTTLRPFNTAPTRLTSGGGGGGEGSISLDSSFDDPLRSSSSSSSTRLDSASPSASAINHHSTTTTTTSSSSQRIPGSYDFEPQGHEGGAASSSSHRRARQTSLGGNGNATGAEAASPSSSSFRRGPLTLRERLFPTNLLNRLGGGGTDSTRGEEESSGLLFNADNDLSSGPDDTDTDQPTSSHSSSYPPRQSHVPLPSRPPQFGSGPSSSHAPGGGGGRVFGGGQGNDGVFANLSAKPDGMRGGSGDWVGGDDMGGDKDEILPAYEVAALDTTPPYGETVIMTPGGLLGPDDICVDGLPVGNLFGFAWNLLVSMSFQFVGFLLTYLLHTTHAAKNGSRAGLGITMIQLGFYLKQRADHPELFEFELSQDATGLDGQAGPFSDPNTEWTWWGGVVTPDDSSSSAISSVASATVSALGSLPTQIHGALSGALDASDPDAATASGLPSLTGQLSSEEVMKMSTAANEWMSFFFVTVGSFLVIGAVLSYWRAVRWARAVRAGQGPGVGDV